MTIEPSTKSPTDTKSPNITIILMYPPVAPNIVIARRNEVGIEIPTINADLIPRAAIIRIITDTMALITAA